jgi:hypothetical protein
MDAFPQAEVLVLESLFFCHFLRRGVLSHSLEEGVQHGVVVISSVNCLESHVLDTRKSQHHEEQRVAPTVEARARPQVDQVVLELGRDGFWHRASNDVAFAFEDGLGHRPFGG